jgi:SulP family sulfate permease
VLVEIWVESWIELAEIRSPVLFRASYRDPTPGERSPNGRKDASMSSTAKPRIPILQGILPIDAAQVPTEIMAGVTLAALAIPEVMGYTRIAGMPVITGLYTILIPMILFALLGSSRHLVVGADSATAAIMAAGLGGLAATASPKYVSYAGVLALMVAILLILARIIRLGFLAGFLSRTALIGFLTGVGVQVLIGEIPGMLGIPGEGSGPLQKFVADFQQVGQTNIYSLLTSIAVLAIITGARKINRKIPGALIAVIGSILSGYLFNLSAYGVVVIGAVPAGLPKLGPPETPLNSSNLSQLLPVAFSMFIVILAQSAATSRAYATRYSERLSENLDLVGLGIANLGAGLTGTFVVNGSPTKTQMVDSARGRSQLAQVAAAAVVLSVLLFLTGPLAHMPNAALSDVVFLIGVELIDFKGMRQIFVERPYEFWVALITALIVVFVGVEQGILLAILLSLIIHTRHGYKPKDSLLTSDSQGNFRTAPLSSRAHVEAGLMIYRFQHSMYYANAEHLTLEVIELVSGATPPLRWFCVDAVAVDDIDFSAAAALREIHQMLKDRGIRLVMTNLEKDVLKELQRSGLVEMLGVDAFYETVTAVIQAYRMEKA